MASEEVLTIFPPEEPVNTLLTLSGSKSFMNRALILGALADSPSLISNPSRSEDSITLLRLLKVFGVESRWKEGGALELSGRKKVCTPSAETVLDVGPAGTVMRFITSYAAAFEGADVIIRGSERMHQRPIGALVDTLLALGANIEYIGHDGFPPLRVRGTLLKGGSVEIDGDISSQFLTSLMLIGATLKDGLELIPRGRLVSQSYLQMTCQTLRQFGVDVAERAGGGFIVRPGIIHGTDYLVEGDASGASYFWGIAAISGGSISLNPFPESSLQGDVRLPKLLEQMGCAVSYGENSQIKVAGPRHGRLKAIQADMENMPDTAQTLAMLAAVADGTSVLTGLQTLRIKETDRIEALQQELHKVGVRTDSTADTLTIHGVSPSQLRRATIATYDDHRMAMSFAVLGAVLPGLRIADPSVVGKSFPDFWERLRSIGFETS